MSVTIHKILNGKVQLYRRDNSPYWQASTFLQGGKSAFKAILSERIK